jgi:hypothetical protein
MQEAIWERSLYAYMEKEQRINEVPQSCGI